MEISSRYTYLFCELLSIIFRYSIMHVEGNLDISLDSLQGVLRVNQRNYEESFVDNPMSDEQQDILILGVHDRNRALHGDVVVVRIKDRDYWVVSFTFLHNFFNLIFHNFYLQY